MHSEFPIGDTNRLDLIDLTRRLESIRFPKIGLFDSTTTLLVGVLASVYKVYHLWLCILASYA